MIPEQCKAVRILAEIDGNSLAAAAGVRLKFDRAAIRQLGRSESKGGVAADDDVP